MHLHSSLNRVASLEAGIRRWKIGSALALALFVSGLRVWASPLISVQPTPSQVVATGSGVVFSVSASGTDELGYQWFHNGVAIAGGTGSSVALDHAAYADWGAYQASVVDSTGTTSSQAGFLDVLPFPDRLANWGKNDKGQATLPGGLSGVVSVQAGANHSLALKSDGTVVAWGDNGYGQCSVPAGLSGVVAVAAGKSHSLALKSDGTVVAWGLNSWWTYPSYNLNYVPPNLTGVIAIAAGGTHSLALKSDGTVVAWGLNSCGQLNVPAGLNNVVAIAAGEWFSLALKDDGTVVGWGLNKDSRGWLVDLHLPAGLAGVVSISARCANCLALKSDGTVVAFGDDFHPYPNTFTSSTVPEGLSGVVAVSAGDSYSLALKADGSVTAWGDNFYGPTTLPSGLTGVVAISAGSSHGIALRQLPAPQILQQPLSQTFNQGQWVTLAVSATGQEMAYQWQKNGANIPGATNASLVLSSASSTDEGDYAVVIGQPGACVTSATAHLTFVGPSISPDSIPAEQIVSPGEEVDFNAIVSGSGSLTYQWLHNGIPIPGATQSTLQISSANNADSGAYQLKVSDGATTATSRAGFVNVRVHPGVVRPWGDSANGLSSVPAGLDDLLGVAAGGSHTLALKADGTVVAWGNNNNGQATVPVGLSEVVSVSAGALHSMALKADGSVVAWGYNYSGQATVPVGLGGVKAIAAGAYHSLALKSDGTIVGWGYGEATVPNGLNDVVAIAAGDYHSLALKADGTVVAFGANWQNVGQSTVPSGLSGVIAIAAAGNHSIALKADGTVVCWGDNGRGQSTPPPGLNGVTAICASSSNSFALKADGTVVAWGDGGAGQTALPAGLSSVMALAAGGEHGIAVEQASTPAFVQVPSSQTIAQGNPITLSVVASGGSMNFQWQKDGVDIPGATSVSLTLSDPVFADAGNYSVVITNSLGSATSDPIALSWAGPTFDPQPVQSAQMAGIGDTVVFSVEATGSGSLSYQWYHDGIAIEGGTDSSLTLDSVTYSDRGRYHVAVTDSQATAISRVGFLNVAIAHSRVVEWATVSPNQPSPADLGEVAAIAQGANHTLALKADGTVAVWGYNWSGQTAVPANLSGVVAIAAGDAFSLALKADGTVTGWGDNSSGQTNIPAGLGRVVAIAAGRGHSLALKADGTVVAWGNNGSGQARVPYGLSGVVGIAAGANHSLALKADGTVVAWGENGSGQTNVPAGLRNVVAIAAGGDNYWYNINFSVALKADGTVVCWGQNHDVPMTAPTGLSGVIAIAAGKAFCLALKADGTAVGWGNNSYGTLQVPSTLKSLRAIAAGGYCSVGLEQLSFPAIVDQPVSQTTNQWKSVTLSVNATGGELSYQWQKDGTDIPGATSSSLALNYMMSDQAGGYSVVVTNDLGSVTSDPAQVSLVGPTFDPTPVQSATVVGTGSSVEFSVLATGSGALNYQWLHNGMPILGATNSSFSMADPQYSDRGFYQVRVSDSEGSATSGAGFLNVAVHPERLLAWGANSYNGRTTIPAGLTDVVAVATGGDHCLALKADGTIVGWGASVWGQITVPPGLSGVVAIAAGGDESIVLKSDGTVVALNRYSACPAGLKEVIAIAAGFPNLALKSDGTVVGWGSADFVQATAQAGLKDVTAIASGGNYGLALKSDGTVVGWGANNYGQTTIPGDLGQVVAIAAGGATSLALKADGTVVAWGNNSSGQTSIPEGLSGVIAISAGADHELALKADGTVVAWGNNSSGQATVPVGLRDVAAISAGSGYSLVLKRLSPPIIVQQPADQAVQQAQAVTLSVTATGEEITYQWQKDGVDIPGATQPTLPLDYVTSAEAGVYTVVISNESDSVTSAPATITLVGPVFRPQPIQSTQVAAIGSMATLKVNATSSGTLSYQWFHNGLPIAGATSNSLSLSDVRYADRGFYRVDVSDAEGTVASLPAFLNVVVDANGINAWGYQNSVPWGIGAAVAIAAGDSHCLALRPDGTVFAWGNNGDGQTNVPPGLKGVVAIAAGVHQSIALRSDGTVVGWGGGYWPRSDVPAGLKGVVAIAAGGGHNLALKSDGTVVAWGEWYPSAPSNLSGIVAISEGGDHSLALKSDGTVVAWGDNSFGKSTVPAGLAGVVAVAAGGSHSLALKADGTVVAWGDSSYGKTTVPSGLSGVVAIAAGANHSLALKADGTVVAWGDNYQRGTWDYYYGQSTVPQGLIGVLAIAASGNSSLSLGAPLPVITGPATGMNYAGAVLHGTVDPQGLPTKYYFEYGPAGDGPVTYTSKTAVQSVGKGTSIVEVSAVLRGLQLASGYHYRLVAINSNGTFYGSDQVFDTTEKFALFYLRTPIPASYQSAFIEGAVLPNGSATSIVFEYGESTDYGAKTPAFKAGAGTKAVPFSFTITGLIPGQSYHGRLVATNATGISEGIDHVFTTLDGTLTQIAATGGSVSGITETNAAFATLGNPILNDNGDVFFSATIKGPGIDNRLNKGIFNQYGDLIAGSLRYIPLNGGARGVLSALSDPVCNNNSQIAFLGTLVPDGHNVTASNAAGIWSDLSGTLLPVIRTGDGVPVYGGTATVAALSQFVLPDQGGLVFTAKLAPKNGLVDATSDEGIWVADGSGSIRRVVGKGDKLEGNRITSIALFSSPAYVGGQTRSFTNAGDLVFTATFADQTQGIYTMTSGSDCAVVVNQNDPATGFSQAKIKTLGSPALNASGQVAYKAVVTSGSTADNNSTAIWLDSGTNCTPIVRTGGGSRFPFAILNDPVCNSRGELAFRGILKPGANGVTASNATSLWVSSAGRLGWVAHTQMQAPDCPPGAVFSAFRQFALTEQGGLIVLADLAGVPAGCNQGIWAVDGSGDLRLVVRKGDRQTVGEKQKTISALSIFVPTQNSPGQTRSFNSHGDLIYKATFTDKTEAIFSMGFP